MKKILILGLGNTIRGDDGAGIQAVRLIRNSLKGPLLESIDFKEIEEAHINILDFVSGYEKLIIIDAVATKKAKPGDIHRITQDMLKKDNPAYSSHQVGLPRIIKMAEELDMDFPKDIVIYAVEIEEGGGFACGVSPEIKDALVNVLGLVEKELTPHLLYS